MSSISVLSNSTCQVDEDTPIDSHPELKGKYGALKVAVDNKLLHWGKLSGIQVVLARPGFITAQDKKMHLQALLRCCREVWPSSWETEKYSSCY